MEEGSEEEEEEEETSRPGQGLLAGAGERRRAQRAGRAAWPYQLAQNFMVAARSIKVKSGRTPTGRRGRRGTLQEAVDAKGVGVSA